MPLCCYGITAANHGADKAFHWGICGGSAAICGSGATEGGMGVAAGASTPTRSERPALLRFVDHFYGPDLGVIHSRRERQQQLALAVWTKAMERVDHGAKTSRGRLGDVEVAQ